VDEATRTQYLLGYYPKDDRWTGRYRKMEVRVNRPGVTVSYRHGYYAGDTALPYDRAEFLAHSRIAAAAAYSQVVLDVKFAATATRDKEGRDRIRIDLIIDPSRLGFKVARGRYTDKLQVAVFYQFRNSKNRYETGQDWRTVNLNLEESTYRRALQSSSIPCSLVLTQPDVLKIKVVVYDFGADLVGSALVSPAGR
jgi:hypothetical protein